MRHDSGLAASPPVRDILGVAREGYTLLSRLRCGRKRPLPNEEFFTLFSEARSNIVERAAIVL
jgi:hypothetical protein